MRRLVYSTCKCSHCCGEETYAWRHLVK